MSEKLRNREEWIIAGIIGIFTVMCATCVALSIVGKGDTINAITMILAAGATVLSGMFAALKVDKSDANLAGRIENASFQNSGAGGGGEDTPTPPQVVVAPLKSVPGMNTPESAE